MAGGKLTPRQKMINMMYLVLTALLALNVSQEVLNAFHLVNEGLQTSNGSLGEKNSGIYNLGSGKARTFVDLVKNTFNAMNKQENISFIDTPADIRDKYQYFTEANMSKLKSIGYSIPFTSLEDGINDYVTNYLEKKSYF